MPKTRRKDYNGKMDETVRGRRVISVCRPLTLNPTLCAGRVRGGEYVSKVVDFPARRGPGDSVRGPIEVLIAEDDRGLFADVDGEEIRAGNDLDVLLKLVGARVKQVLSWKRPTT